MGRLQGYLCRHSYQSRQGRSGVTVWSCRPPPQGPPRAREEAPAGELLTATNIENEPINSNGGVWEGRRNGIEWREVETQNLGPSRRGAGLRWALEMRRETSGITCSSCTSRSHVMVTWLTG